MGKDGFVVLSYRKATKISEIVQNIQSLVPGAQPGFDHIVINNRVSENRVTDGSG